MTVFHLLREFPAIWATIGLLVGGGVTFLAYRKLGPIRDAAMNEVIKSYEKNLALQTDMARTQHEHHEQQLAIQREHLTEELTKIERSRDEYKEALHCARNDMGAEITHLKLKVQEMELRPNVEVIHSAQEKFYTKMIGLMELLGTELKKHDEGIEARTSKIIEPVQNMCNEVVKALNGHKLVLRTRKKKLQTVGIET